MSGNFWDGQPGVAAELSNIIRFNNIESLIIQGRNRRVLRQTLIPFITDLATNDSLQELDISGNEIGDQGLTALAALVRMNTSLKVLSFEGAHPLSLASVFQLLTELAASNSLLHVPFPTDDIFDLIETCVSWPDESREWILVSYLKLDMQAKFTENRARVGVFSALSLLHDKVLDELIDDITLKMRDELSQVTLNVHSAITDSMGLPLPFIEDVEFDHMLVWTESTDDEPYGSEILFSRVRERPGSEPVEPMQFNSLLMRRPDAARNEIRAPLDLDDLRPPAPTRMEDVVPPEQNEETPPPDEVDDLKSE
jgi:hypothetical protein